MSTTRTACDRRDPEGRREKKRSEIGGREWDPQKKDNRRGSTRCRSAERRLGAAKGRGDPSSKREGSVGCCARLCGKKKKSEDDWYKMDKRLQQQRRAALKSGSQRSNSMKTDRTVVTRTHGRGEKKTVQQQQQQQKNSKKAKPQTTAAQQTRGSKQMTASDNTKAKCNSKAINNQQKGKTKTHDLPKPSMTPVPVVVPEASKKQEPPSQSVTNPAIQNWQQTIESSNKPIRMLTVSRRKLPNGRYVREWHYVESEPVEADAKTRQSNAMMPKPEDLRSWPIGALQLMSLLPLKSASSTQSCCSCECFSTKITTTELFN